MKRKYIRALFLTVIAVFVTNCAAKQAPRPRQPVKPMKLEHSLYTPKVDHFMVLFDASLSMGDLIEGETKLDAAKRTVSLMNQTIPALGFSGGLRTFGQGDCLPKENTSLIWGVKKYSETELESAINTINCVGGNTPMESALDAAGKDLEPAKGEVAVLVISDGITVDSLPLRAAEDLKAKFGERLCIYTILVGDHSGGKALMEELAEIGQCGFAVTADSIASSSDMAAFVEKIFLLKAKKPAKPTKRPIPIDSDRDGIPDTQDLCPDTPRGIVVNSCGCPMDTDKDGVYDYLDKCADTPRDVRVDSRGCPLDTDGDGVYDYLDECSGTPKGAKVDSRGCWVLTGVKFESAKWDIKSQSYPSLDEAVAVLNKNPNLKVEIQGHSDNVGRAKYNQLLSEKRAKAVKGYLVNKGIEEWRLSTKGYGMAKPITSNASPEGRAKNRRVELIPTR